MAELRAPPITAREDHDRNEERFRAQVERAVRDLTSEINSLFVIARQTLTAPGTGSTFRQFAAHQPIGVTGRRPTSVVVELVCKTAELGYAAGDVVQLAPQPQVLIRRDSIEVDTLPASIVPYGGGAAAAYTAANWDVQFVMAGGAR